MTTINDDQEITESLPTTIGPFLKEKREQKNLSLELISQHTRISLTILEALEDDKLSLLPNQTYVKGYIKNYVKLIDVDQNEALKILSQTYQQSHPNYQEKNVTKKNESTPSPNKNSSEALAIKTSMTLLLLIAIGAVVYFVGQPNKKVITTTPIEEKPIKTKLLTENTPLNTSLPVETPLENDEPTEKPLLAVPTEKVQEENQMEPELKETTSKPVEKKETPPTADKKIVEAKTNKKSKKEITNEIKLKEIELPLYVENKNLKINNTVIPKKYQSSIIPGKQNVFINAIESDTWITYKADKGPIKKFVLRKGRKLMIRGNLIRIFLGNIRGAKIFLNNTPLTITSQSGVKSLIFPQERAKDFKLPLFLYPKNGGVITSMPEPGTDA